MREGDASINQKTNISKEFFVTCKASTTTIDIEQEGMEVKKDEPDEEYRILPHKILRFSTSEFR